MCGNLKQCCSVFPSPPAPPLRIVLVEVFSGMVLFLLLSWPPATSWHSQLRSIEPSTWQLRSLQSCSLGMMARLSACGAFPPSAVLCQRLVVGEGKQFAATSTISLFSDPAGSIFESGRWHLAFSSRPPFTPPWLRTLTKRLKRLLREDNFFCSG